MSFAVFITKAALVGAATIVATAAGPIVEDMD